ncbi:MAG: hypothetical protein PVJ25_08615, partial [Desulfuromonadales bacterium]
KNILLFILVFSIHISAYAVDEFSTIEERMTGREFRETGLEKLTDKELAALNDWLRRHPVATLDNASARPAADSTLGNVSKDTRGLKVEAKDDADDKVINGTIAGTFEGWNGKGTLFKLTNGMVWQQTENDTFYVKAVENPEITITRGFMGNWRLSMVGHNSAVRVKRIK